MEKQDTDIKINVSYVDVTSHHRDDFSGEDNAPKNTSRLLPNRRLQHQQIPEKHKINRAGPQRLSVVKETDGVERRSSDVCSESGKLGTNRRVSTAAQWEDEWLNYEEDDLLDVMPTTTQKRLNTAPSNKTGFVAWDDDDFETEEERVKKETERKKNFYRSACKLARSQPIDHVTRSITTPEMNLQNRPMSTDEVKAISISLVKNTDVQKLDLTHSQLSEPSVGYVTQMIQENVYITELSLADNNLGTPGAKLICNALVANSTLLHLDVAGNGFEDCDGFHIGNLIEQNNSLKHLSLAHNGFSEEGGTILGEALSRNTGLENLDISWNKLRRRGAVAISDALKVNGTLTVLNVSWNGFGIEGCLAFGDSLGENNTLVELDLTANRIILACLLSLLRGIKHNTTLQTLKIGHNSLTDRGAFAALKVIGEHTEGSINYLDITDVPVDQKFVEYWRSMQTHRHLKVTHGTILRKMNRTSVEFEDTLDPIMMLFEYMKQDNLRLVDLFHRLDTDKSSDIDSSEIQKGLMTFNIPFDEEGLKRIMKKLDVNGDGVIDFDELKMGRRENTNSIKKWQAAAKKAGHSADNVEKLKSKVASLLSTKPGTLTKANSPKNSFADIVQRKDDGYLKIVFQIG
ncbi:unnamed protein product [Owenia fusiformis]|uniref:Uncharacterized protein n=1 Tax=Owenia fusiformis TaxID=6347 RepID=A0A8J1XMV4_OWEFU|nr:unnamed protein product [Owenia fusiformis]